MSKTLCSEISEILTDESAHNALMERSGSSLWNEWTELSAKIMRTSLRAFVIGEKGLIRQAGELEKEYGDICRKIRDVIAGSYSYGRDVSKAIRLISLMQGFLGMSKILAEDEELYNFAEDTAGTCDEGLFEGDEEDV